MFRGHRDLKVFQLAYRLAMEIFHLIKHFPREETYSLTDQIRRSSRSVAANIAEGFENGVTPGCLLAN
jgi:four helix bundle protein